MTADDPAGRGKGRDIPNRYPRAYCPYGVSGMDRNTRNLRIERGNIMRWNMNITERQIVTIERNSLSDVVTMRSGEWPLYAVIVLTQTQARDLASALMAAGFDWSRDPNANPQVGP